MKKILLLFTFLLLFSSILLVSCKDEEPDDGETVIPKGTVVLNVYNWGEYISDGSLGTLDVNAEFEKYYFEKTGVRVKVNYTTYATNEDMYSKITSGAGTYDIIIPSDYMIERLKNEDMLYAFDPATTVENYGFINDFFKDSPYYDPDNLYSVPYTYGMVGIIY
ncbi:MAG: extracellular solute-binding protein, partial [Clostridia bacterium]|nr:extracellular solute-binding protein [Clostridia bacterium]